VGGDRVAEKAQLAVDKANHVAILTLSGEWTVRHLPEEERVAFEKIPANISKLIINGTNLDEVDTSGAWMMIRFIRSLNFNPLQMEWMGFSPSHLKLINMVSHVKHDVLLAERAGTPYHSLVSLGKYSVGSLREWSLLLSFFGQLCVVIVKTIAQPKRLRLKSVIYHANEVGIKAMPIIILLAFCISLVLGYQGANQLKQFGAMPFTVNLVAISLLREMGVLITAIMASGRSCSAFAAQIGVMQMNDEVAAMRTLGLDPFELLVLPRVLGIIIALPALTFVADMAGLLGTYFVAAVYLDMSYQQFMARLQPAITEMTFYIGLMKAPVFALIIGVIGCFHGLQVRSSATELGLRTTTAVVQSIFLVVLMDALFSVIFTMMNI
jgi:phospholipid/cholesterol/gamma-HCH transport system permease protein